MHYVCDNLDHKESVSLVSYQPGAVNPGSVCPAALAAGRARGGTGNVEILASGGWGAGVTEDFANQASWRAT